MLKVNCQGCGAPYDVDPRRIPKTGLKMRCPACGTSFHVHPQGAPKATALEADLPAPKSAARPAGSVQANPPAAKPQAVSSFELDLPAPKPAGGLDMDVPALKKGGALAPAFSPAPTPAPELDLDLPAPKAKGPLAPAFPAAKQAPELELDLPAPKAKGPLAPAFSAPKQAPELELDLPAPKAKAPLAPAFPAPKQAPELDLDLPAPKAKAPLAPAFSPASPKQAPELDLDLPAPKAKAPLAPAFASPAPELDLDLPQPKRAAGPAAPRESDLDLDLPAPKGRAPLAPAFSAPQGAPELDFDLPAPKAPASLDANLPARKGASAASARTSPTAGAGPQRSFTEPKASLPAQPPAARAGSLPKDSLAIDPEPFFQDRAGDPLGTLDDLVPGDLDAPVPTSGGLPGAKRGALRAPTEAELPAPGDLPQVKRPQAATLPKDSLDLPAGFASLDVGVELKGAPGASAPRSKAPAFGELDLPPPDLKGRGMGPPTGLDLDLPPPGLGTGTPRAGMEFDLDLARPGAPATSTGAAAQQRPTDPLEADEFALPLLEPPPQAKPKASTMALSAEELELEGLDPNAEVLSLPSLDERPPGLPDLGELDPFADLKAPARPQTMELDALLEPPAREPPAQARRGIGSEAFGEIDFGLSADVVETEPLPMPVPIPVEQTNRAFDAEALSAELGVSQPEEQPKKKKKKRKPRVPGKPIPAWVWPVALLVLLGGTGVALGLFTPYGWFGVYLVEQFLPEAGDPQRVAEAIAQAEKQALSDTYVDVRKSLTTLSDARNEAGLNRELLARSLLHEALYQLRFGEDAHSAQRAVAILARVMERGTDVPGLTLARAADAARQGNLQEAKRLLAQAPKDDLPYHGLVAGEIALLDGQPAEAAQAFTRAEAKGGARARWGLARALVAEGKLEEAEAQAQRLLQDSPRHSAALAFLAERALTRGETEAALDYARKASGRTPVDQKRVRASRADRARALALEGMAEEKRDHPREAQAAYEQALALTPLNLPVLIGSGRMLMRLGRARDALTRFDSALGAKPSDIPDSEGRIPLVDAALGAAQALLAQARNPEAVERTRALLAKFPEHFEVNLWHGHALSAVESWDEAEAAYRKAIELTPSDFAGYVGLSQLLFKLDRPEEAARVLSEATGKVKDSADVRRMLGHSELMRHHLPEALRQFQAALRFDPNDAAALFGLGVTQRRSGDLDAAEKTLERLAAIEPTFPGLSTERGQLLEGRGDYEAAAEVYRKALEDQPHDTDLKLRLGAALVTADRVDEAEALLREVLKERPTSAEAEHFIGRVLFARGEAAQAAQRFERAVNFDAQRGDYHMYLAWAALEQENLSRALESVNKAVALDPSLGDAHWILGRVQLRTGAVKDAVESFQRALKLKPGRVEALAGMGDAYDQLRDLRRAVKAYQEAVKQRPDNGQWWYRLGMLHLDRGSRDEARVALAEAVLRGDRLTEKPHWLPEAHRNYADLLRDSEKQREALEHYRMFLELAPAAHPARTEVERLVRALSR